DLLAVHADPGEAAEVLDVVEPALPDQPSVAAGDVLLHQPDQVPLVPANGDFVADQGDDGLAPLVILDDQLHERPLRMRPPNLPQRLRPPQRHLPMKAWTWSQSLLQ